MLKRRIKRLLVMAELEVPEKRFPQFRQLVLDELGKSGFLKDLERVFRS